MVTANAAAPIFCFPDSKTLIACSSWRNLLCTWNGFGRTSCTLLGALFAAGFEGLLRLVRFSRQHRPTLPAVVRRKLHLARLQRNHRVFRVFGVNLGDGHRDGRR